MTWDLKEMVILDVLDNLILQQGRYPEQFVLISLLGVCQEWGVKKGGTWGMLKVPDRGHGSLGHHWHQG